VTRRARRRRPPPPSSTLSQDALADARSNLFAAFDGASAAIELVECDAGLLPACLGVRAPPSPRRRRPPPAPGPFPPGPFDTVVSNPPFGTKPGTRGADLAFVRAALRCLRPGGQAFTLHKSSTRDHLRRLAEGAPAGGAPAPAEGPDPEPGGARGAPGGGGGGLGPEAALVDPRRSGVVARVAFALPASYAFHRERERDVAVDVWRWTRREEEEEG